MPSVIAIGSFIVLIVLAVCLWAGGRINPPPHDPPYPAHWWSEISKAGAPSWEIFPQDAKYGEVILSKRNELGLLSNFAPTPFKYRGRDYASVEGFWQSLKYPENSNDPRLQNKALVWPFSRKQVELMTGFEAKRAGDAASENMKKLGINWVSFEGKRLIYKELGESPFYRLIEDVMKEKLKQNPEVRKVLIQTGDLKLRPDHVPGPAELKAWQYHEIWMKLRSL